MVWDHMWSWTCWQIGWFSAGFNPHEWLTASGMWLRALVLETLGLQPKKTTAAAVRDLARHSSTSPSNSFLRDYKLSSPRKKPYALYQRYAERSYEDITASYSQTTALRGKSTAGRLPANKIQWEPMKAHAQCEKMVNQCCEYHDSWSIKSIKSDTTNYRNVQ